MAKGKRAREAVSAEKKREPQAREVFLLDELGRFVAGSTAQGIPVMEGMLNKAALALARAVLDGREVPPGTFVSKAEGDAHVAVYGGREFFGCAGEDALTRREVPHELAAVVEAFEKASAHDIAAGGLRRETLESFPKVVVAALQAPARYAAAPVGPLAFARAQFRPSGARLALDIEVVNATPWEASRVELRLVHDERALALVSVKAKSGGYARGVLTLPPVSARARDRAVLLFEPRQAGLHVVEGELTLGLDGGGERRALMRRARTAIGASRVVPTVPKTLKDFSGLIGGRLAYTAPVDFADALGGMATAAGLSTEIEKDRLAKVLDWHGRGGEREVWYLGVGGAQRPLLVQVTERAGAPAEVVVAAAARGDLLSYAAHLRARLDVGLGAHPRRPLRIEADQAPEGKDVVLRAAIVAQQISADLETGEFESLLGRPPRATARVSAPVLTAGEGRSAGEEMVPGLIEAFERTLRTSGRRRGGA